MNWMRLMRGGMLGCLLAGQVMAEIPRLFNYQARLSGFDNEVVSLTVTIYDAPSGGTALYTENQTAQLQNGIFALKLGAAGGGVPISAVGGNEAWVGLSVNGDPEFAQRSRLVSVPYAFLSRGAEGIVIPDTNTPVLTVGDNGEIEISDKISLFESDENAGRIELSNDDDIVTASLNAAGLDTGGRLVLANGTLDDSINTVRIDGDADDCGQLYMYDENGIEAIRLNADRANDAAEFSMFMGPQLGQSRETVELVANSDGGDSGTGGKLVLRHVSDPAQTATKTVELRSSTPGPLEGTQGGPKFEMSWTDGSPVFTVQGGTMGALFPLFMEMKAPTDSRSIKISPSSIQIRNINDEVTLTLAGSTSTFTGDVTVEGEVTTSAVNITGGSDLSEGFHVNSDGVPIESGMVVCIDPDHPGDLQLSTRPYDMSVAGVISGAGGVNVGMMMSQEGSIADGDYPVALTGRVWVHCDASAGAIVPGHLLTTSSVPGHAMRAKADARAHGAIIGKAMTRLGKGERGLVLVLVNLQ